MKNLSIPLVSLFLSISFLAFAIENTKKEPKVLVLVVAGGDLPVYIQAKKMWRSYMHLDREHFEVYFITSNPDLPSDYAVSFDEICSKTANNYSTGMVHRTLVSLKVLLPRMKEFDYVLRTNLSSFYVFPRLLKFIKTLPQKNCYCGFIVYTDFPSASGAGFLLSQDLVERMVRESNALLAASSMYEDLIIARFFYDRHIGIIPASRMDFLTLNDWMKGKDSIPENIFHFRIKNLDPERRLDHEVFIQSELVKMFYPNAKN